MIYKIVYDESECDVISFKHEDDDIGILIASYPVDAMQQVIAHYTKLSDDVTVTPYKY